MPTLHQIRPTVKPYCEAEALLIVRLSAGLTAGKTSGYRLKAALASIPRMNMPDERKAARSRFLKLKKPAPRRPTKAISGKMIPHGRWLKLVYTCGCTKKV